MSPPVPSLHRPAWVDIDCGAVRRNLVTLAQMVAPAEIIAVVKGDAYGHGAVQIADVVDRAGAAMLAVATIDEAIELRTAGIESSVLLLAEAPAGNERGAVDAQLSPVVASRAGVARLAAAASAVDPTPVHLKIDTGMRRVGCRPSEAMAIARAVAAARTLRLDGVMTHLALADEPGDPTTETQLDMFDAVVADLDGAGLRPKYVHAANSAGAIAVPRARYDAVRVGIAVYGIAPAPALSDRVDLVPALRLSAEVAAVRSIEIGDGVSYGHVWRARRPTRIATIPLGYADGVPRALGAAGGAVLIDGLRCPIVGNVTMDQLMVDVDDREVPPGAEAVLIGEQGTERIDAWEWAELVGTIAYEIVTRLSPRVPRRHHD